MADIFYINSETKNNKIYLTYCHKGEIKYAIIDNYKPTLFGLTADTSAQFSELVSGKKLEPTVFNSIREANNVLREAHKNDDVTVFGNRNFHYTFLHENFKDMENSYDISKIRGFMLDIECVAEVGFPDPGKAEWPINVFCIYDTITQKYFVWGESAFDECKYIDKLKEYGVSLDDIVYEHIADEVKMLKHLLRWWREHLPAYITGWNSSKFDIPYLCHRLQRLGLDMNKLSPWKNVFIREGEYFGKPEFTVHISGVADLDYLELYKKNRFITRESYKLDFIGEIELGRKKVDFSHIANNLRELRKKDYDLFTTYNIIDVELIKALEEKLGFLSITFAVAYAAGINYGDVKSPVVTWSNIIYRTLIDEGVVLPNVKEHDKASYQGGFVLDPKVGKHRWVCSFDLASLYPSLIMQFNISPETLTNVVVPEVNVDTMMDKIKYKKPDGDLSVCPSGNTFKRDKFGIAGREMLRLYTERKSIKKEMLVHEQNEVTAETELKRRGLL
ncbi:DNA polymerase [Vibrio phage henriette 12B8]|uniref:DNA polymerase n=1 Tax=Vibrio phage henriette 12B8 TaxID=573174 RepID=UPI0002C06B7A|nr:DNA polymerase [Vibrio phage henriette 12B8]AGG58188.1 DNA polymerase [Vibrio phage henriette 12B8]